MKSSLSLAALVLAAACSAPGRSGPRPDGGTALDTGPVAMDARGDARRPISDTGSFDPFNPDAACGATVVPTVRLPGSLLLLFDRSGSMDSAPGSARDTKWVIATRGINTTLATLPDDLSVGLLAFPTGEGPECDVTLSAGVPHVPVDLLSTTRAQIASTLATLRPTGRSTPIFDSLRAGYSYLDTLTSMGQRGLVVVTDGAENCDEADKDLVLAQVATELATKNYLTFVVGLTQSNSVLSTLAFNGGTPRNSTCLPDCTPPLCNSAADCAPGVPCNRPVAFVPGQCGCNTSADCVAPQTCMSVPIIGSQCTGPANCCHFNATAASFEMDFTAALNDIARRFLDSCLFDLPAAPGSFDPAEVNVGVTFAGESRTVLPLSSDPGTDSWNYTTPAHEAIVIQGSICDRLLMGAADVEIVLGCPTILI